MTQPNSFHCATEKLDGYGQAMTQPSTSARPFADIGARIRWHREHVEAAEQKAYAARAGLTDKQLSNWETGYSRLSIDGALRLRETYGLSLDFLYAGIDDALPMTLRRAWRDRP